MNNLSEKFEESPKLNSSFYVRDIPNLDVDNVYIECAPKFGIPRIIIPSGHEAFHIKGYNDCKLILSDQSFSRKACNYERGPSFLPTVTPDELLLNTDAPHHQRRRMIIAKDFSPSGVKKLKKIVEEVIQNRVNILLKEPKKADLFKLVLDYIPATVDCELLGIPQEDKAFFRPLTHTVQMSLSDDVPDLLEQFYKVYGYMTDLVEGKRKTLKGGLIQRYVANKNASSPPMEDKELTGILLAVLLGGDQNILTVLTKILYVLLSAPLLWQELVRNPEKIDTAVEELIRLIPLGNTSAFPRISTQETQLNCGVIPKGEIVYVDVFAANRDDRVYSDPMRIDFNRKGPKHLQFGYGMHNCMGAYLARLEISSVLKHLVFNIPTLRLDAKPETLFWQQGVILRRPESLPVSW
jgi:cytochrome P450